MLIQSSFSVMIGSMFRAPRSEWMFYREEFWFEILWMNRNNPDYENRWRSDFRMCGQTFSHIVDLVRANLEKRDTHFRKAIPIEKRVAVAIWRLSTGNSFRSVSKTFAIGKSTAVTITREFCVEMMNISSRFIKFPVSRKETSEAIEKLKVDIVRESKTL